MANQDRKNLKKRYLIWLYKTTKESLDKIERKFTQLEIDKIILDELKKLDKAKRVAKFLEEFRTYMKNKEKEGMNLKYEKGQLKPNYYFLDLKLKAIEKAIVEKFGRRTLQEIKLLYEKEMTERILRSMEHK